eukprot:gene16777-8237_t
MINNDSYCTPKYATNVQFVFVAAIPFNLLIMKILVKDIRPSLPRHKIVFCLSIADGLHIITAIVAQIALTATHSPTTSITCNFIRGSNMFFGTLSVCVSSFSIIALSVERYIACVYSFRLEEWVTKRKTYAAIAVFWIVGISGGIYSSHALIFDKYRSMAGKAECFKIIITLCIFGTSIIISAVQIKLFTISKMQLSKIIPPKRAANGEKADSTDLRKKQFKVATTAGAVAVAYIMCMLPLGITTLLDNIDETLISPSARKFALIAAMSNALLDPIIYGLCMKDMRKALTKNIGNAVMFFISKLTE